MIWIMSQDKETLVETGQVSITTGSNNTFNITVRSDNVDVIVGTYPTKQRAMSALLEVKDSIRKSASINGYVCQMPLADVLVI